MLAHTAILDAVRTAHEAVPGADPWAFHTRVPDRISRPTFLAWPVAMERTTDARRRRFVLATVEVWLLSPHADEAAADAQLDPAVAELVGILEAEPMLTWERLERGVLDDRFQGWRAVLTLAHTLTPDTP